MRQTVKARTIKKNSQDASGEPTKASKFTSPKTLLFIFIVCLFSDAFLLSHLAPHMVLSGPTPIDTLSLAALPCIIACLTIFTIGLVNKLWYSRLVCLSLGMLKVLVVVDLGYNLFKGSFDTNIFESTIILAYSLFYCSVGLLFSCAAINFQSKFQVKPSTTRLIIFTSIFALAQITYLNQISNPEELISLSLSNSLIYSALAYITLNFGLWYFVAKNKTEKTLFYAKILTIPDKKVLFHVVLLTISTCFIWTPLYTCFANSSSISAKFLDISLLLYLGVLSFTIFSKYLKGKSNLFFCSAIPLFLILSVSRWDILTTPSLVLLGLLLSVVSINSIEQICKLHNCPLKPLSLSMVAIVIFSFTGGLLLSNPQAILPPAYVMQTIGLVFFAVSTLVALKFNETRKLILKFTASNLLRFRSGLLLVEKQFRQRNHELIASRLNLIESIAVTNYLTCPIFIASNDGFLNLSITKFFLSFFNAKVFSNESKAIAMAKISLENKEAPIVYSQNNSKFDSKEFFYFLDNKRCIGNGNGNRKKTMYSIESNSLYVKNPILVPKLSASHIVSQ